MEYLRIRKQETVDTNNDMNRSQKHPELKQ